MTPAELGPVIILINYFGDVVFAISGALTASRFRMDIIGHVLIGTITGIGGGTIRDIILERTVWWTQDPLELILCVAASLLSFFLLRGDFAQKRGMVWGDALGLAAFSIVGCHVALAESAPLVVAVFMGMLTATGGGIIRDLLTRSQPMILCGELYASAALLGALVYALMSEFTAIASFAAAIAFPAAFALRAVAIIYRIKMGPPGELLWVEGRQAPSKDV